MKNEPWREDYINLLSNPCDNRTNKDFCIQYSVSHATFYRWLAENREELYVEADKRRKKFFTELREKNFKAIAKNLAASFNDRKLMAQLLGDLIERSETRTEIITPEEKRARLAALLDTISKQTGQVPLPPTSNNSNNTTDKGS